MNKKNKIFLFNPYPSTGGADTTIHRFTNSINLKKFDAVINCSSIGFNKQKNKSPLSFNQLKSASKKYEKTNRFLTVYIKDF